MQRHLKAHRMNPEKVGVILEKAYVEAQKALIKKNRKKSFRGQRRIYHSVPGTRWELGTFRQQVSRF
jgi:predicted TIM-barrel fold metal-dependent hydrolase